MIAALNGLHKDIKSMLKPFLDSKDWTAMSNDNGQHTLLHKGGAAVLVYNGSGGGQHLRNIRAKMRRVEKEYAEKQPLQQQMQLIPSEDEPPHNYWESFTTKTGHHYMRRTHQSDWEYRCSVCGKEKLYGLMAVSGHQRAHGPSTDKGTATTIKESEVKPTITPKAADISVPVEAPTQVQTLAQQITALVEAEIEAQIKAYRDEIEVLKAKNKHLRDSFNSIVQLAAEEV